MLGWRRLNLTEPQIEFHDHALLPYGQAGLNRSLYRAWEEHFEQWLGKLPDAIHAPCCGEFAVSSAAIKRLPLAFYTSTRAWVMRTEIDSVSLYSIFDFLWHYFFTGEAVLRISFSECFYQLYGERSLPLALV